MDQAFFLVSFPKGEAEALHWWQVSNGRVVSRGCNIDPLLSAGLNDPTDEYRPHIIALIPASLVIMRWHERDDNLTEQQSATVALAEARSQSLAPDSQHWIVSNQADKATIVTASVETEAFENGLNQLSALAIDPGLAIPVGALIESAEGQIVQADFGFETVTRSSQWVTSEQRGLLEYLVGEQDVDILSTDQVDAALANASDHSDLNFRSGRFAEKRNLSMTAAQRKILIWCAAALLLISLAIPAIQVAKFHGAADEADEKALTLANTVLDNATDLKIADQQLDKKLIAQSLGSGKFSIPASALFSALQETPGVSISRLSYDSNGILSAELTALRNEDINPALITLQSNGFLISATPRQDATGTVKADITVRVP